MATLVNTATSHTTSQTLEIETFIEFLSSVITPFVLMLKVGGARCSLGELKSLCTQLLFVRGVVAMAMSHIQAVVGKYNTVSVQSRSM